MRIITQNGILPRALFQPRDIQLVIKSSIPQMQASDQDGRIIFSANYDGISLQNFTRYFGDSIKQLTISYSDVDEFFPDHQMIQIIMRNCSRSLEKFVLSSFRENLMVNMPFLFANVTDVCFNSCDLNTLPCFLWFHKMSKLNLNYNTFVNPSCVERHFPKLKHFYLRVYLRMCVWT